MLAHPYLDLAPMNLPVLFLFLSKFVIFAVLGLMFFRKAKHNVMWVMTALPFVINAGLLIASFARPEALPAVTATPMYEIVRTLAATLCVVSIALYMFTLGAHRVPLPGWHQANDRPAVLVSWGPYRRIRHPFYSSYIVYFTASLLLVPTWPVLLNALYLFAVITFTAAKEEKDLAVHFGDAYRRYMSGTGRFFPSVRVGSR
jgi:protein-S-isoprenylcysteine O-methyltransferase Ste14